MPSTTTSPPRKRILEKSRTVRRRYQRSNKRLEFTASQIARIERDEAREKRAKQLREREKKRVANKKKRAEKEAAEREERRRRGVPEQCAQPVPSSQPLLERFLMKRNVNRNVNVDVVGEGGEEGGSVRRESMGEEDAEEQDTEDTEREGAAREDTAESGSPGSSLLGEEESLLLDLEDDLSDDTIIAGLDNGVLQDGKESTEDAEVRGEGLDREKDDDEFSDCSIFYDEDLIKEADNMATLQPHPETRSDKPPPIGLPVGDSFQDDTADLLEAFAHEFDTDEEFERELVQLDAV